MTLIQVIWSFTSGEYLPLFGCPLLTHRAPYPKYHKRTKRELLVGAMTAKLTDIISDQWHGLKKFAADLAAQLPGLGPQGNRGVKANLVILENWLRAALLTLAEQVALPARQKNRRAEIVEVARATRMSKERRLGFRCMEPDAYEKDIAAENRFDISQVSGGGVRISYDQRPAYHRRLEAIEAVLDAPETYARRVKHKLEVRKNRARIKRVNLPQHSALPDLARVSPHSDLGRYVWYNDSS